MALSAPKQKRKIFALEYDRGVILEYGGGQYRSLWESRGEHQSSLGRER
jgi:hypothetical protein